ncbi:hypothetical protein EDC01DRAFT_635892 [Geopyxis carbonaria]|nr:hypothetical protein EDC01DRAFT_635892 [Geopyxis carbonaria]
MALQYSQYSEQQQQQFPFDHEQHSWDPVRSKMDGRDSYHCLPHLGASLSPPLRGQTPSTSSYEVSTPRSYTDSPPTTVVGSATSEPVFMFPHFFDNTELPNSYPPTVDDQYLPAPSEIYSHTPSSQPPSIRQHHDAYVAGYDGVSRRSEQPGYYHPYQDRTLQDADRDAKRMRLSPFSDSSDFDSKDRASIRSLPDYTRSPQFSYSRSPQIPSHSYTSRAQSSPAVNGRPMSPPSLHSPMSPAPSHQQLSPSSGMRAIRLGSVPSYHLTTATLGGITKKPPRKNRRRLGTVERKQVHQLRKMGACTRCWGLKMKCDKGSPCHRCEKLCAGACVRVHFVDLDVFSKWLVDTYSRSMMHHHVLKWTDKSARTITVSHEKDLNVTLPITVHEFEPAFPGQLEYWFTDASGWKSMPSPPYAMKRGIGTEELENYIHQHTYHYVSTAFQDNKVLNEIFRTAYKYSRTEENYLVRDCLQLWTANQLLIKGAMLHPSSDALEILPIASASSPQAYQTPPPRVTANQLDHLLERRIWQLEKQILAEVQKKIFGRQKKDWLKIFFTLVILMNALERDTWRLYYWILHMNDGNEWRHPTTPEKLIEKNDTLAQSLAAHFTAISKGVTPFALDWSREQTIALLGKCDDPEGVIQGVERMGRWLRNPEHALQTINVLSRYRDNDESSLDYLYSSKAMIVY